MNASTPADHLAWAICATVRPDRDEDGERPCRVPCSVCRTGAAAVIRPFLDQVLPELPAPDGSASDYCRGLEDRQRTARFRGLAIAAELEAPNA